MVRTREQEVMIRLNAAAARVAGYRVEAEKQLEYPAPTEWIELYDPDGKLLASGKPWRIDPSDYFPDYCDRAVPLCALQVLIVKAQEKKRGPQFTDALCKLMHLHKSAGRGGYDGQIGLSDCLTAAPAYIVAAALHAIDATPEGIGFKDVVRAVQASTPALPASGTASPEASTPPAAP